MGAIEKISWINRKTVPIIYQSEVSECGLACLAMISSYYGASIELVSLRHKYNSTLKGTSLKELINLAEQLSLSCRPVRMDVSQVSDLKELSMPCILHWEMNHFVVLDAVNGKHAYILDPAKGKQKVRFEELSEKFTGVALELYPNSTFEKKEPENRLKLGDFAKNIVGLKPFFAKVLLLSLSLQIVSMLLPIYTQVVIDSVVVSSNLNMMTSLAIGFTFIVIFNTLLNAIRSILVAITAAQINIQFGSNIFKHLIKLPVEWFTKRHTGDIVSRFSSIDTIQNTLTNNVVESLVDGLLVIGTLTLMFAYSAYLATVTLVIVMIFITFRLVFFSRFKAANEDYIVKKAALDTNFIENVRSSELVKLFTAENIQHAKWLNHFGDSINASLAMQRLRILFDSFQILLFGFENIIVIYIAATLVVDKTISVGMLVAFLAFKGQFRSKATSLIDKLIDFKMLRLHFQRLGDIVLSASENIDSFDVQNRELKGEVELRNVTFRYSDAEPYIIRNLSAHIKLNESVAITGPSGCGKTTLMKLMLGLLKPTSGQILIDGIPIEQWSLHNYRKQIASIMQEDKLLSGTLIENITFFSTEPDIEWAKKCAFFSVIAKDIHDLPMKYNTIIGDMGNTLSGGQKQRLFLARAFYKSPKVLFLDESTSHLDVQHEKMVNENIRKLGATKIFISHRVETINSADWVIKLEKLNDAEQNCEIKE
ncbi:peptidase domain-containing ABC transporter [Pleionea sp. CnH1-48]|uniref:peptidase domain-containing ABC transporter n=1 Tax=Pleionea sp. CnH1-48 TaxID=2954494 RepID=UPI002097E9FD|nr:peptidase domain-containing ABC transporter [Pleionea sp. CnH1-48]MCO7224310.1 peptidase domain-containing ABC transporter [Pleionea sp. CnH1-48]